MKHVFLSLLIILSTVLTAAAADEREFSVKEDRRRLLVSCGETPILSAWETILVFSADRKLLASGNSTGTQYEVRPGVTRWKSKVLDLTRTHSAEKNVFKVEYSYKINGKSCEIQLPPAAYSADFFLPLLKGKKSAVLPQKFTVTVGEIPMEVELTGKWTLIATSDGNSYRGNCRFRFSSDAPAGRAAITFRVLPGKADFPADGNIGGSFLLMKLDGEKTRSFRDSDKKDGWMGQGGYNDLRNLSVGVTALKGIPFYLSGRAFVLRSKNTPGFPASTGKLQFRKPEKLAVLYFLQTAAWGAFPYVPELARWRLCYQDGTHEEFPVRCGREVEDWWILKDLPNAKNVLRTQTAEGRTVGLFLSRIVNPHPGKPLSAVELVTGDKRAPVALVSLTGLRASVPQNLTAWLDKEWNNVQEFKPGRDWKSCAIPWQNTIETGSALDLSFLNHVPAGKYGFLKRVGEHFEFEKKQGEKVRFWGTNLAIHGPFPAKDLAPGIAACLAKQGVNLARIHLYANRTSQICSSDGGVKAELLDKLFFLISELKKNGIYIYWDMNDGMLYDTLLQRKVTYPQQERLKYASLFDPELQKAVLKLNELILTRKNPYTGLALAEDPALAMVESINELSMVQNWEPIPGKLADKKQYLAQLTALWKKFLKEKNLPDRPLPAHFEGDAAAREFGYGFDRVYYQRCRDFLHGLNIRVPQTGTNLGFNPASLKAADGLDFYGDHVYFNHPTFTEKPMVCKDIAALRMPVTEHPAGFKLFRSAMAGYPVVHSEWNYCFPASTRAEGIPVMAATGAYQDWSGLIFYGATGSCDNGLWDRFRKNSGIMIHSQQTDPSTWGLSQFGALLYRRGDVRKAERSFEIQIPEKDVFKTLLTAGDASFLGQFGKLRMRFIPGDTANPLSQALFNEKDPLRRYRKMLAAAGLKDGNTFVSDSRELRRHLRPAAFVTDTFCSQSVSGALADFGQLKDFPRDLRFETTLPYGSICLTSLDGLPIAKSRRMLFVQVGNSANSGQIIRDDRLISMGTSPVLTEPYKSSVTLSSDAPAKVFAVSPDTGKRMRELPCRYKNGKLSFDITGRDNTIYYEITKH